MFYAAEKDLNKLLPCPALTFLGGTKLFDATEANQDIHSKKKNRMQHLISCIIDLEKYFSPMIFTVGSFLTIDSNSFHPFYFTLETIT